MSHPNGSWQNQYGSDAIGTSAQYHTIYATIIIYVRQHHIESTNKTFSYQLGIGVGGITVIGIPPKRSSIVRYNIIIIIENGITNNIGIGISCIGRSSNTKKRVQSMVSI